MNLIWLLILFPAGFILSQCYSLYKNYQNAKKTGLSIVISPIYRWSIFGQVVIPLAEPILKNLPTSWTLWARITDMSKTWEDNDEVLRKLGPSCIVVSPQKNTLITAQPEAINSVLSRRKDFIKTESYEILNLYGRNVDTVNGEEWTRHRKVTAPCFNERVSGFVWDESRHQAKAMLDNWLTSNGGKANGMVEDTRILALHVLSAAGFGISQDFNRGSRNPAPGHTMSHKDSLMLILYNVVMTLAFPFHLKFLLPFMPKKIQQVGLAMKEFRQYMDEMLDHEREAMRKQQGMVKPNLISTLIRTSDEAKDSGINSSVRLTDDEIRGNIFIFNLAGHDTTANTLAYAFALLALHPEYQDWLMEEVDAVLGSSEHPEYEKTHPKLKRCMAVMYETLRLYGPVVNIPRGLAHPSESLPLTPSYATPATDTPLPPNTDITLNIHAAHTDRHIFSPDPLAFRPTRWLTTSPSSREDEELVTLPPGAYSPWSLGPRICPGMKFAQVEFTGVMSLVMGRCRVYVSEADAKPGEVLEGERAEKAREGLWAAVRDSGIDAITLTMRRPERVWLQFLGR